MTVDGKLISSIEKGLLIFAAIAKDDSATEVESMASKILKLKMWDDDNGVKVGCSLQSISAFYICV